MIKMKIQPQGNIIATGEDGVPWELYENGYLLFKPEINKDTLTNQYPAPSWKKNMEKKLLLLDSQMRFTHLKIQVCCFVKITNV